VLGQILEIHEHIVRSVYDVIVHNVSDVSSTGFL